MLGEGSGAHESRGPAADPGPVFAGAFGAEATAAIEAALAAGRFAREAFDGPLGGGRGVGRTRRNGAHDVVTRLDLLAERSIASWILDRYPLDGFVGEEMAPRPGRPARHRRLWLVDPIDGTVGFSSGIPFFSVSVALAVGSRVVVGVVHDPIHDETFVARRGSGAWLLVGDGDARPIAARRLRVRRIASARDAVVAGDPGDPGDADAVGRVDDIRRHVRVVRTLGSTALSLAYLAGGRLDGVVQVRGLQAVDIAAGGLLAREAGARVSDADGGPWFEVKNLEHGRGIAAGGRAVHASLLEPREGRAAPA